MTTITIHIRVGAAGRIDCEVQTDRPPSLTRVAHELHRMLVAFDATSNPAPAVGMPVRDAGWLDPGEPTAADLGVPGLKIDTAKHPVGMSIHTAPDPYAEAKRRRRT